MVAGRALFSGVDADGNNNLWITDGTAAGTHELKVAGAAPSLAPANITVLGGKALFEGFHARGRFELWVTDGTSGGTVELKPAKANALGLFDASADPDFTVLGDKALFQGYDSKGQWNLWVTDGTLSGTQELMPAGADPFNGLIGIGGRPDFTVVGKQAVFVGLAPGGNETLWVTDGTSAGTRELKVKGGSDTGLFSGVVPDFTVLGHKVLFQAEDTTGHAGLWVTDGTAAGTTELHVASVIPYGIGPAGPSFTVLGGKALFIGAETSSGRAQLWVTNGTAAGTSALSRLDLFKFVSNPHFTVLGSKALFVARSPSFTHDLWVTDGTAAGTKKLEVASVLSR
jgi:ELWxxDGT repeat protein